MPKFDNYRRITYGPNKGGYEYRSWLLDCYFLATKRFGEYEVDQINVKTDERIGSFRFGTLTEADKWITRQELPLREAAQRERMAERKAAADAAREKAEREKAERLSVNSHLDSDVIIKASITRTEAIKLAERLLHWAVDSYEKEPLDSRCIDFTVFYTDSTRSGGWREEADDTRMSVGVGWTSSGDDISPRIHDSYVGKREQPEAVSDEDDLGVAI